MNNCVIHKDTIKVKTDKLYSLLNNFEVVILALRTSILSGLIAIYYVYTNQVGLNLIFSIIGVLLAALLEVGGIRFKPILRIRYGMIYGLTAGFSTFLGSYLSSSVTIVFIILICAMFIVGFSSKTSPLIALLILYTANLFAISSGIPGSLVTAFHYGLYFMGGSILMAVSDFIAIVFLSCDVEYNDHANRPQIFKLDKDTLGYSCRLSFAVCGAYLIAHSMKLSEEYCAPMTALLITKIEHDFSWQRISHRLFGTLWGSVLAIGLILLIHDRMLLAILLLPVMFMIIVSLAKHYGLYVFFLTTMITILFNIITFEGASVPEHRAIFTAIGISCAVVVLLLTSLLKKHVLPHFI